jgi:hypothetical protein
MKIILHLNLYLFIIRGEVWPHKTSLTLPLLIEMPYQAREATNQRIEHKEAHNI